MAATEFLAGDSGTSDRAATLEAPRFDVAARQHGLARCAPRLSVFNALYWTGLFIVHTSQMVLARDMENASTLTARGSMMVVGFILCMPLGWLIRRAVLFRFWPRILTIAGACVPLALLYTAAGYTVWTLILEINDASSYSPLLYIVINAHYNFILFLLWSAFCGTILFASRLQEHERSLLEARALAHEAELKMLRYQINPHFLFNTLNAVSALIVTGQAQAADEMIAKLARFFRNALSRESTAKVTIAEELRVQLEYLDIELTRFADRVSLVTEVDRELTNALVPHLILQPLFENAIKHGVARSSERIEIRTTIRRDGGNLVVTQENTAHPGVTQDEHRGAGVGLANVAQRLASFYGGEASMRAAPRDGKFVVELRLPLELTL